MGLGRLWERNRWGVGKRLEVPSVLVTETKEGETQKPGEEAFLELKGRLSVSLLKLRGPLGLDTEYCILGHLFFYVRRTYSITTAIDVR